MSRPNGPSTESASTDSAPSDTVQTDCQRSESGHRSRSFDPTVRWYQPGDAEGFLSLYEAVWGTRKDSAWFDWRFRDNPAARGVEMVVAEADGQLVGAEPVVPYRLRIGDGGKRLAARQPVDWIVHPEYRRMGVFSAMTERLLAESSQRADLLFNFPNEALRPGIEDRGWRMVDTVSARYRVQDPVAALEMGSASSAVRTESWAAAFGSPILDGGLRLLDRTASPDDAVTVEHASGVPAETVGSLYAESVPDRIHVPRTRAFLEWRFANPRWDVETYVARRGGDTVATGIVAVDSVAGHDLVRLLDVQPMASTAGDADSFEAVLAEIVAAHDDAAVIKLPTGRYPAVCRRYGFVRDDAFPVSRISATTYHAVRPLDPAAVSDSSTVVADPGAIVSDSSVDCAGSTPGAAAEGLPLSLQIEGGDSAYDLADPGDWLLAPGDMDVG